MGKNGQIWAKFLNFKIGQNRRFLDDFKLMKNGEILGKKGQIL